MSLEEKGLPAKAKAILEPGKNFDLGRGRGNKVETELSGGVVGIILDGRGRPFHLPEDDKIRVDSLKTWMNELNIYPEGALDRENRWED
jgi:hypothetical protein